MTNRSTLHELTSEAGARFAETAGWVMPTSYGHPRSEYEAAYREAALFDISHHARTEVTGGDATSFLHNLCTNDVKNLAVGRGCGAFLTTGQAKIVAYVFIWRLSSTGASGSYLLDAGPVSEERVLGHLDRFLISEQVCLADRTEELAQLHIAGPGAAGVLVQAGANEVAGLVEHEWRTAQAFEVTYQFMKHSVLGSPGYDLICGRDGARTIWNRLVALGARPAGTEAYNILRVEAGTPVYGQDIDEGNLPQEVGRIAQTISFTKGCYIGQETVARIRTYGHVNRSLVGLIISQDRSLTRGTLLLSEGKEVGQVTSSVVSPRLGAAIAMGYVRRGKHEIGTLLEVDQEHGGCTARVVSLPFITATQRRAD
jgi:folate-binding protein YgfZ